MPGFALLLFVPLLSEASGFVNATIDITRAYQLPDVPGLAVAPPIPVNLNSRTFKEKRVFRMSRPDLETLLTRMNLPSLESKTTYTVSVPQFENRQIQRCSVRETRFQSSFIAALSDRSYLKSASFWCKVGRKLFGGCKPKTLSELAVFPEMTLSEMKPEASLPKSGREIDLANGECVSQPIDPNSEYHRLRACATGPSPSSEACRALLKGAQPASREKGEWTALFTRSETRTEKTIAPPRVETVQLPPKQEQRSGVQTLKTLKIGALSLVAQEDGTFQSEAMAIDHTLALFPASESDVSATGDYQVRSASGEAVASRSWTSSSAISLRSQSIRNYPERLKLPKNLIVELHQFSDREQARHKGEEILKSCEKHAKNLTEFGEFVCGRAKNDIDSLTLHMEVQFLFRDQDQTLRSFTFERKAPIDTCTSDGDGFSCSVPDQKAGWEAWLDNPAEKILRAYQDPYYEDDAEWVFAPVIGFLPVGKPGEPLRGFITPQGQKLESGL
ncbi:MAG: hypothetical protein A2X94_03150 [Bdellovibrionales bacterium GWB1_55_8]|nr:MAG: hypothetical protein A2X94_03150 [Bdellovibrionales bacterium GWB1_55_8]